MTNSHLEFSDTVRLLKVRTGETNADLALILGITGSAFSTRLRGETGWRLAEVEKLADHWGMDGAAALLMGPEEALLRIRPPVVRDAPSAKRSISDAL